MSDRMSEETKEALRLYIASMEDDKPAGPSQRFTTLPVEGPFTLESAVAFLVNELSALGEGDMLHGGQHIAFLFYATAIADLEYLIEHGTTLRSGESAQERGARAASILRQTFLEE